MTRPPTPPQESALSAPLSWRDMVSSPQTAFDYAALTTEVAHDARAMAERIRGRIRMNVIETGRDLLVIKDRLNHGQFLAWIEAECWLSARTAQEMMTVADWIASKSATVAHLEDRLNGVPPVVLYSLASPSTPEPVRETVLPRIARGEAITAGEVKAQIKEARRPQQQRLAVPSRRTRQRLAREQEAVAAVGLQRETALGQLAEIIAVSPHFAAILRLLDEVGYVYVTSADIRERLSPDLSTTIAQLPIEEQQKVVQLAPRDREKKVAELRFNNRRKLRGRVQMPKISIPWSAVPAARTLTEHWPGSLCRELIAALQEWLNKSKAA